MTVLLWFQGGSDSSCGELMLLLTVPLLGREAMWAGQRSSSCLASAPKGLHPQEPSKQFLAVEQGASKRSTNNLNGFWA